MWTVKGLPSFTTREDTPRPTMLSLTKKGTSAAVLPSWINCTTCQPPRPSGTVIFVLSAPPEGVAWPSGIETMVQHVPLQFTRLPTTVDHTRFTGASDFNPEAVSPTFVFTAPEVDPRLTWT